MTDKKRSNRVKSILAGALVSATMVTAGPNITHASTFFEFRTGLNDGVTSMSFTADGITLVVTAQTTDLGGALATQNVSGGLGACTPNDPEDCTNAGDKHLDSIDSIESLTFQIAGGDLSLETFLFNAYSGSNADKDRFQFFVDGFEITSGSFKPAPADLSTGNPNEWSVVGSFGPIVATDNFVIRAAPGSSKQSKFRIAALTGTVILKVSEPATLVVFGFGLAGLGYMRRRRAA